VAVGVEFHSPYALPAAYSTVSISCGRIINYYTTPLCKLDHNALVLFGCSELMKLVMQTNGPQIGRSV